MLANKTETKRAAYFKNASACFLAVGLTVAMRKMYKTPVIRDYQTNNSYAVLEVSFTKNLKRPEGIHLISPT